jgi:DNA-binding NarL/FixJ family response regulator
MSHGAAATRVFLADDSVAIRNRIAGLLEGSALEIVGEAASPQACIDGILATHPDVVVLDVQLKGGQGLDVLREVRGTDPAIAFVVFSNNASLAYRKRYLAAGAIRFLDKSAEFEQLADAISAARSTP